MTGARLFVIESPSMGETAPVGTLVLGLPVPSGTAVRTGEIVTYRPPDSTGATYTHRVVEVVPGGYRTRGDINGADDPWVVRPSMIATRAVALVPALGWLFRIAPLLACGSAVIWVVSQLLRDPLRRFSFQTVGVSAVLAAAIFVYRPFVGYVLLTARSAGHGLQATVVSTGLLPIRVQAAGGDSIHLVTGAVGHCCCRGTRTDTSASRSTRTSALVGWSLLIALCLLPTLYTLLDRRARPDRRRLGRRCVGGGARARRARRRGDRRPRRPRAVDVRRLLRQDHDTTDTAATATTFKCADTFSAPANRSATNAYFEYTLSERPARRAPSTRAPRPTRGCTRARTPRPAAPPRPRAPTTVQGRLLDDQQAGSRSSG